ncbi:hypothetical protein P175DRAFT_0493180 [Aspergillus ochraceoroseus IBT 24754]|uniref:Zn(2)-C6 fungal-type domain-containing protein n=2 Tax=Aspergillus ochraceoroseus TaxID=138278 RepID=A0A2T5LX52_9EURO|nr:uncharacterized protein P175DRAFT_0493180 [Aspergillus ochraceoroseus IBT 24754]KKK22569.1 hypothetical protein AOCH_004773 [Aspergillus ochraceoroseus]PTU20861.1 hypothetical protein P175DRAFT_0493180 [Aspergillus ochraceoroseus IBT 24754]
MSSAAGPSTQPRPPRSISAWGPPPASTTRNAGNTATKTYKRSRSGCYTCRLRRKKCDESHPTCGACTSLGVSCEYRKPSWWISTQARLLQKEQIKNKIRETKVMEKEAALKSRYHHANTSVGLTNPTHPEYMRHALPSPPNGANKSQMETSTLEPSTSYLATPTSAPPITTPYGLNTGAGNSTFIPATSSVQDPTTSALTSTVNSTVPPPVPTSSTTTAPAGQSEEWYQGFTDPPLHAPNNAALGSSSGSTSRPLSFYLEAKMTKTDRERSLLYHFADNVLRLVFPVLDIHKDGQSRAREILNSLDSNKSYFHCCLSVSAIHLKTIRKNRGKRVDNDIMRHRYAAVSELCKALNADNGHDTILDATLAMIFFHCSVGSPDDSMPDIPWNEHFTAVTNLVEKLGFVEPNPYMILPFSMSLSTWIDILGATMLGKSPQFAHNYRIKHLSGVSSGLRELMGCDDRIMYLISEIACLECLKGEGLIDDYTVCNHVAAMTAQLDHAEKSVDPTLENPLASGTVDVGKLTKNMTAIFRVAARIHLYSLLPTFAREQQTTVDLVQNVADLLQYIPSGPSGFDRSLIWPMLITGAFSTPTSSFRALLTERSGALGESSDFGSFGRMYCVLQEVWRLSDDPSPSNYAESGLLASSSRPSFDQTALPSPGIDTIGQRNKRPTVHWRDAMRRRGWQYLLI